ncbi:hypothetical protein DCC85_07370 [Paenibacillus sp. CAA11]|uniref:YheC/YheD family endospore coat-associated protein n=1 Tax=Paenibacillus sp. CAA11 TaxID=1532905 RepID=UPI000D347509|nr:YheC/YheD family protein [Paenibacillus sp. CAA11]AWB44051.1 hypothetical protein DCC85_07370 [Paenibacillus sp. CAA11]
MPSRKLTVQIMNSGLLEDNDILVNSALVKRWKIPANTPLRLSFGSMEQMVQVVPHPKLDGLRISRGLAGQFGIFARSAMRFSYKPSGRALRLGPLIGVLISRDIPDSPDRPFGNITMFCKELALACHKQGAHVYFFTPSSIEQTSDKVQSWVYAEGWRQAELPIADVFYNRLTSRKLENKPSVQHFMSEVKSKHGSHFFNEKYLDKTEVFSALKDDSSLVRYLPESHAVKGTSTIKSMLGKHPVVFLKPVRGSLGKGIIRITKQNDGTYVTHATRSLGTHKQAFESQAKLLTSLSGKIKTTRYQIQQGLPLLEVGKRPVDFRALVQKNAQGKWAITSVVARIAGSQHFVSNLARGGSLCSVNDAVNRSTLPAGIKSKADLMLKKAALLIAQGVDERIPAHFGELGIDLAMDAGGKVYLLEVNSKPSKNDNTPLREGRTRPSVRRILDYANYLAGC